MVGVDEEVPGGGVAVDEVLAGQEPSGVRLVVVPPPLPQRREVHRCGGRNGAELAQEGGAGIEVGAVVGEVGPGGGVEAFEPEEGPASGGDPPQQAGGESRQVRGEAGFTVEFRLAVVSVGDAFDEDQAALRDEDGGDHGGLAHHRVLAREPRPDPCGDRGPDGCGQVVEAAPVAHFFGGCGFAGGISCGRAGPGCVGGLSV
ncbi:hypothetical protein [Streptomyces sp. NPDC097619]|uniref:hypothetical protein n=1 Tax=Streptomyces sp. NPDC097619 TaxID=3157228 RepID=UPI003319A68D